MKEEFENWLIVNDNKTENTAYSYKNAIPKLSKHFSDLKGKTIDFFYSDLNTLKKAEQLYSLGGNQSEFGSNSKGINRNAIVALIRFYETFPAISAKEFYSKITEPDIEEAFKIVDTSEIALQKIRDYAVINKNNGNKYPPKEIIRIIARTKHTTLIENTLNGGEANAPFKRLKYIVDGDEDVINYDASLIESQTKKYQSAIENTNWLKIDEVYKFNFINWIENNIDFEKDSNEEIQKKIKESQQIPFSPNSNAKGVNFIQTIIRYQDDYITIDDLKKLRGIIQNNTPLIKENLIFSFGSFPKTSAFLCLFAPERFMAYDGESLPSYEFFSKGLKESAPKRNFKAFRFYQKFYTNIKKELKESSLDTTIFKEILNVETLTELHWNFITQDFLLYITREVMTNSLQKRYNYFIENEVPESWDWYKSLSRYSEIMKIIKERCYNNRYNSYVELNLDFKKLAENDAEDFLQRYLFESNNGFSTIKQQLIKLGQRKIISEKLNNDFNFLKEILIENDKQEAFELVHTLIEGNNWSVIYRFLRALFPNHFTSVDAPNHFESLINKLDTEFNISLASNNQIERNEEILNLIQFDDIYKAQIFFWEYKEESIKNSIGFLEHFGVWLDKKEVDLYVNLLTQVKILIDGLIKKNIIDKSLLDSLDKHTLNILLESDLTEIITDKNSHYFTEFLNEILMKNKTPLNQILYGPPGTGKTYQTKKIAVEIIENKQYSDSIEDRKIILDKYESLVDTGQIHFTTFHQSLSYEDFIEGIKPVFKNEIETDNEFDNTTGESRIEYEIKDGIFKNICQLAEGVKTEVETIENIDFDSKDFYKMSLGGKNNLEKHKWSIKNNLIFLGWGNDKNFTHLKDIENWKDFRDKFKTEFPELVEESKYVIQAVYIFQKMKIGDIIIVSKGNHIIDAIGVIESEYFYDESQEIDNYQFRKVKWLSKDMNISPEIFLKKSISQQTIYKFDIEDIKLEAFDETFKKHTEIKLPKNYVLIIDEINRGNISSIFGELITLIEPDKRIGSKESIRLILPYSKKTFAVPDNLYIIGTMNTADRSVEALDTALRRRFSFNEVSPNTNIILEKHPTAGKIEGDLDIALLLDSINRRIDLLINKDHKIGHSYFLKVLSLSELKNVFNKNIIPLLEEYFYGDYGKIGLVLGNQFVDKISDKNKTDFADFSYDDKQSLRERVMYKFIPAEEWTLESFISIYDASILKQIEQE